MSGLFPQTEEAPELPSINAQLDYLVKEVWRIRQAQAEERAAREFLSYTVADLARLQGCSASLLRNNPWKMPNYGRSDIGRSPAKWLYRTCSDWYSVPEDERRRKWEMMGSRERRKAQGRLFEDE
jgi:uncharacterized alpha-E superfamily protein